jgi:hypothetical protein
MVCRTILSNSRAYAKTSCVATVIIATNNALDKVRSARDKAEALEDISSAIKTDEVVNG